MEVAVLVVVGTTVVRLVMVPWAVVDRLLLMVDEIRVDEGTVMVELAALVVRVEEPEAEVDSVALLEVSVAVSLAEALLLLVAEAEAVAEEEEEEPLDEESATILKGKPYWKMVGSESREILMP